MKKCGIIALVAAVLAFGAFYSEVMSQDKTVEEVMKKVQAKYAVQGYIFSENPAIIDVDVYDEEDIEKVEEYIIRNISDEDLSEYDIRVFSGWDYIWEEEVDQLQDDNILVQGEDFKITKKDFVDYKENLAFIHKQNDTPFSFQSEEIINEMVEKKLLYSYAKEADIEVTEEEIREYALQTKEAFEDNATPELDRIHAELAKRLNVAPEAYFTHPDVLKQYEEVVAVGKLVERLFSEGKLNDGFTLEDFKKELRESSRTAIQVNGDVWDAFD